MPDPPGTPAPTPAAPGLIDEAINSDVGLLFSPEAPRATSVTEKKEDQRAVWACVPPTFDLDKPTVLIYLHGFNGYVTVSKTAPTGVIRKTEQGGWVANFRNDGRRGNTAGTRASGPKYKIDQTFTNHSPLVLVPEVGLPNLQSAVSVDAVRAARIKFETDNPAPRTPAVEATGPPDVPPWAFDDVGKCGAADGLGKLLDNCFKRLAALPKTAGGPNYLDPAKPLTRTKIKRLFLSGHSGGGKPLAAFVQSTPTEPATEVLNGTIPTDLWALDATYNTGADEYKNFCSKLDAAGKLGFGAGLSRFVAVVIQDTGTDKASAKNPGRRITEIVAEINGLKLKAGSVVEVNNFRAKDASQVTALEAKLKNPMVVIRVRDVAHDEIPTVFIPIFMRTAATV